MTIAPTPPRSTEVVDCLGQKIEIGSSVIYPVRRGSNMWLQKMGVQQIVEQKDEPPYLVGFNADGRRVSIYNLKNAVCIDRLQSSAGV